jgi:hypothetical protein
VRLRVQVLFVIILHIGGGFLFFFCGEGGDLVNQPHSCVYEIRRGV